MYLNDDLHHHILLKNEQSYASLADRTDFAALLRFSSILFVPSFLSSQQSLFKCTTTQFQKIVFAFNV